MTPKTEKGQTSEKSAIKRLANALTARELLALAPDQDALKFIELSQKEAIVVWNKRGDAPGTIRIMHYRHDGNYLNDTGYGAIINSNWDSKCTQCKKSEDYHTKSGQIVELCICDKYSSQEILEKRVK